MVFIRRNAVSIIVLFLVSLSWISVIDRYAEEFIDSSIVTATVSFGFAKAFNAIVSVLSTITLQVPLIGSIQIGELLDPLNDMVEDFSTVIKYAIGSLLIQKIMVEIFQTIHFKIILTLTGLTYIFTHYYFRAYQGIAYKAFVITFACKFSIALVAIASSMISSAFVDDAIERENTRLSTFPTSPMQLDQTLDLSSEIKVQIKKEMDELKSVNEEKKLSEIILVEEISFLKSNIDKVDKEIKVQTADSSLIDKIISETATVKALKKKYDILDEELDKKQDDLDDLRKLIIVNEKEYQSLKEDYESDDISTFQSIKNGIGNLTFAAKNKVTSLVNSLNLAMESFLMLMAMYIFKVIIIPIAFLFGMYKFFKAVVGLRIEKIEKTQNLILEKTDRISD